MIQLPLNGNENLRFSSSPSATSAAEFIEGSA